MKKLILLITLGLLVSFTSNVKAQTCKAAIDYIFSDTTNTYTLLNTGSSGKGYSFYWDFGDGKSSTSRFVTHTYAKKGTYRIVLYVYYSGSGACSDSATVTIKADGKNPCNADFNILSDSSNIYKYKFVAIDTSETNYSWYFPTTGSTKKKVDYTFAKAGNYSICLDVQTQNEHCVDTVCKTIKVGNCKAKFGYSIDHQKKTVNFSDSSTVKNTKYYWVFGDGKTSFSKNPSHAYSKPGNYRVLLVVIDSVTKCLDSIAVVIRINTICKAEFSHQFNSKTNVSFLNKSASSSYYFLWTFGDGSSSTAKNPGSHTYSKPGKYWVTLLVKDSLKTCFDSTGYSITISPCNADFYVLPDTLTYLKYYFVAISGRGSKQHSWYYSGVTSKSNLDTTSFKFPAKGNYTVCHILRDTTNKCSDTVCKSVSIGLAKCDSTFNYKVSGDSLYFSFVKSAKKLVWDFGDGHRDSGYTHGSHTYSKPGTYNVCLTVYCIGGKTKKCVSITIKGTSCSAKFSFKQDTANKLKIAFTNLSTISSSTKFVWKFGDGKTSADKSPAHTYGAYGKYTVCLFISDSSTRCSDSVCVSLNVSKPACDSFLNYQVKGDTIYYKYQFGAKSVRLDFGDGTSSNSKLGAHGYSKPGTYKVCLTALCSATDSSKYCFNITISSKCKAFFTIALDTTKKFKLYLINKSSNTSSTKYFWSFGDSSFSSKRNPTHQYSSFGKFEVCITVTDTATKCTSKYCDSLGLDSNGRLYKQTKWDLVVLDEMVFGINKVEKAMLNIYPNPASSKLYIELGNLQGSYHNLEIVNVTGEICMKTEVDYSKDLLELNIENLPKGLYLIKMSNNHDIIYKRMIKN
jgi:PKD repeat protein